MIKRFVLSAIILSLAFFAGMKWQSFLYTDTCLDMGGGQNPGNYDICVIGN